VPWTAIYESYYPVSLAYSFILKPSRYRLMNEKTVFTTWGVVDIKRVILELIALTAIFVILFILTLRPKKVLPGS